MPRQNPNAARRFFNPDEAVALQEEASDLHEAAAGEEREFFFDQVSKARPELIDELPSLLQKKAARVRPFARQKLWALNNHDDEDALPDHADRDNHLTPFPYGETQQPSGVHLSITEIEVWVKGTLEENTYDVLLENYGLRVHYHDERPPLEMPLADVLNIGKRHTPDAGVDATYDPVAGTQTVLVPTAKTVTLRERDAWIVKPGDTEQRLEIFRLPDVSSDPALTGESADLWYYVIFRGAQMSVGKGKS